MTGLELFAAFGVPAILLLIGLGALAAAKWLPDEPRSKR